MQEFDFLIEDEEPEPKVPEIYTGPNPTTLKNLSKREFGKDVLRAYHRLGGLEWLLIEAKADPKNFMELLKKMVPTSSTIDDLQELTVKLINKYGETAEIELRKHAIERQSADPSKDSASAAGGNGSGQPNEIATSGNPIPIVKLKETYDD